MQWLWRVLANYENTFRYTHNNWATTDDNRLSKKAREIILDPANELYYSTASVIEVDWKTKSKNNNLEFTTDEYVQMCHEAGYIPSPLKESYIIGSNRLSWNGEGDEHRDPFDRMLLAQADGEEMFFMTHDEKISHFKQDCVILV